MKFFHLADLHLGKKLGLFPLIEDQEYILREVLVAADAEKPDAILVAGDIFDKSIPSEEAIRLWDFFLLEVAERGIELFAIAGNHDSPIRFSEHSGLLHASKIHLSGFFDGTVESFSMKDGYGDLVIWLLPFVKPSVVRNFFENKEIGTYDDALRAVVDLAGVDPGVRNVILSHQFVTGGQRSDSEECVGTIDNIDSSIYEVFDYVALGHLHRAQSILRPEARYSGSPLKYSLSEIYDVKSMPVVTLRGKGDVEVRNLSLKPLREIREVRGLFRELTDARSLASIDRNDFYYIVLTDETELPNVAERLRTAYPRFVAISYENSRTRAARSQGEMASLEEKTPLEIFDLIYERQNGTPMSAEEKIYLGKIVDSLKEEDL